MKHVFILVSVLLIAVGTLQAQEFRPAVRAGSRSLNFTFGGFGGFGIAGAGVSGGISYSHFTSSDVAYRIGLQAVYNRTTTPWNDNTPNGTNPGADGTQSSSGIGVSFDYVMYMEGLTARVRPYWGPGIQLIYNMSDVKPPVANGAANGTTIETKNGGANDGITVGVGAGVGAEFFLYPELSLSAEYQLNLFSITSRSDRTLVTKGNPDFVTKQGSSMQILGFGAAGATLHIYF